MRATGIIRRVDDLGRVVIPKEIRRTLKIREGDPLEIFTERLINFQRYHIILSLHIDICILLCWNSISLSIFCKNYMRNRINISEFQPFFRNPKCFPEFKIITFPFPYFTLKINTTMVCLV